MSTGYVYFVQSGPAGPIKIGYSRDWQKRIASLQTAHHNKLLVLLVLADSSERATKIEKILHEQFRDLRQHGEWFQPEKQLLDLVDSVKNADCDSRSGRGRIVRIANVEQVDGEFAEEIAAPVYPRVATNHEVADLIALAEDIARNRADGHLSLLRFTSGWKVFLHTPLISSRFASSERTDEEADAKLSLDEDNLFRMKAFPTLVEALRDFISAWGEPQIDFSIPSMRVRCARDAEEFNRTFRTFIENEQSLADSPPSKFGDWLSKRNEKPQP